MLCVPSCFYSPVRLFFVVPQVDREQLLKDVRDALYAAKICSYAQGMMLIQAASKTYEWDIDLGTCARIWKGGCIIRGKWVPLLGFLFCLVGGVLVVVSFFSRSFARSLVSLTLSRSLSVPSRFLLDLWLLLQPVSWTASLKPLNAIQICLRCWSIPNLPTKSTVANPRGAAWSPCASRPALPARPWVLRCLTLMPTAVHVCPPI